MDIKGANLDNKPLELVNISDAAKCLKNNGNVTVDFGQYQLTDTDPDPMAIPIDEGIAPPIGVLNWVLKKLYAFNGTNRTESIDWQNRLLKSSNGTIKLDWENQTIPTGESFTATEKSKLASITEIFTTALKTSYDNCVSWIATNGASILAHLVNTSNPHSVTKSQIGLPNVDNTSDASKPVSTAVNTALDLRLPKPTVISYLNQSAAIPTNTILNVSVAGLYQFQLVSNVTVVGNRSVTVQSLTHTEGGITKIKTGLGYAVNTNNINNAGSSILIFFCDASTIVQFSNTITGTTGTYNQRILITKLD